MTRQDPTNTTKKIICILYGCVFTSSLFHPLLLLLFYSLLLLHLLLIPSPYPERFLHTFTDSTLYCTETTKQLLLLRVGRKTATEKLKARIRVLSVGTDLLAGADAQKQ